MNFRVVIGIWDYDSRSLLVYNTRFFHLDSALGVNNKIAEYIAHQTAPNADYENITIWTQTNGYDCGIFVIYCTELLISSSLEQLKTSFPSDLSKYRQNLIEIIKSFETL